MNVIMHSVKVYIPCRIKEYLNLMLVLDTAVSFLVEKKIFALFDLFTNIEKRYTRQGCIKCISLCLICEVG